MILRRSSGFKGVAMVEREDKEKKLVLVIKATLLSFAVKESRQMGQSWVVVWCQMELWGFLDEKYYSIFIPWMGMVPVQREDDNAGKKQRTMDRKMIWSK